jgi:hypothetical protein
MDPTRSSRMPPRFAALLVAALALLFSACPGGARDAARSSSDGVIHFDCPVADAEVWVNGRYLEDGLRRGIAIAPGTHRIEVRHDDYHTFYAEVTVGRGERRVVEVRLAEILP